MALVLVSSPGELAREWIVIPLTDVGELVLMSTRGNDWAPAETLSVDGMLAVGMGLWGNVVAVSDADLPGLWSRPYSLTVNLTRFVLFRMPAFRFLPRAPVGSNGCSSFGVGKGETPGHGEDLLAPPDPSVMLERRDDPATGRSKYPPTIVSLYIFSSFLLRFLYIETDIKRISDQRSLL